MAESPDELHICQCRDEACAHRRRPMAARGYWSWCQEPATTTLYHADVRNSRPTVMCAVCAADAIASGDFVERA
jgi:hypothetical protein